MDSWAIFDGFKIYFLQIDKTSEKNVHHEEKIKLIYAD